MRWSVTQVTSLMTLLTGLALMSAGLLAAAVSVSCFHFYLFEVEVQVSGNLPQGKY